MTITAVVTETDVLYLGDVKAEVIGPDPAARYLEPGDDPWQTDFTGGLEGTYTATVSAQDRAGNVASDEDKTFILDGTLPELALTLAGAPPLAHVVTDTVYYGVGSGVFTATATATDTLAGLFSLAFPDTTDYGATYGLSGAITGTRFHSYDFDAGDSFSATVSISASDRAGNVITQPLAVIRDTIPPTVTIHLPGVASLRFRVAWSGDDECGVRRYDVQYKAGAEIDIRGVLAVSQRGIGSRRPSSGPTNHPLQPER